MDDLDNRPKWSPFAKIYNPLQCGSIDGTDTTPHDRALIRAMEAKYLPPNKKIATPNPEKTLFVGRLDHKTTEEYLKKELSEFGTVTHCRVVRDVVTGFSKGYAFVQFKHHEDAEKARRDIHRTIIHGREVFVDWENGRTMPGWVPRRLGGGFGGKKESGQLRFGGRDRPFRKPIVIQPMKRRGPSNLEREDGRDRQPDEDEEERRSRADNQLNEDKQSSDRRTASPYSTRHFSRPWNRRNQEYSSGRGRDSSRVQMNRNEEEDRRYSGKSSRNSNENDFYSKGEKDRRYYGKRDKKEWEDSYERADRKYSTSFSRDRGEERDTQRRSEKLEDRSRRFRGRDDPDERDVSRDRRSEKNKHSKRSFDPDFDNWEGSSETRIKMEKMSRKDTDRLERSSEIRIKKEGNQERSVNDEDDSGDWDDTPERCGKDKKHSKVPSDDRLLRPLPGDWGETSEWSEKKRSRRSSGDRDLSDWENSPERPGKEKQRSRRSSCGREDSFEVSDKRSRKPEYDREDNEWEYSPERPKDKKRRRGSEDSSDVEEREDERKSKKKKKRSKKSSKHHDESEDDGVSHERKKKKKKHKKSRD